MVIDFSAKDIEYSDGCVTAILFERTEVRFTDGYPDPVICGIGIDRELLCG